MPIYTFLDEEEGIEFEDNMTIAEKAQFLEANPEIRQVLKPVRIVAGVGGIKTDDGFKEVLSKIGEAHPTSEVAKEYGNKGIKETRVRNFVEEKRKKAGLSP